MFRFQGFPKCVYKRRSPLPMGTFTNQTWKLVTTTAIVVACAMFVLYSLSPNVYSRQKHAASLKATSAKCPDLHYSPKTLPLTALVSSPGSGNTWMRHLLQQATGERVDR